MKIKQLIIFLLLVFFLLFVMFEFNMKKSEKKLEIEKPVEVFEAKKEVQEKKPEVKIEQEKENEEIGYVKQNVPFVVQAPFGNWKDEVFQNACEESSIVMAMGWVRGVDKISAEEANKQILEIVEFENKAFGYDADTNLKDVEKIFKQYFKHDKISIKNSATTADIISEIEKGNIIIVPAFGRDLGNVFYTPPGPVAHMLVIVGYDSKSKQFITNDPGTKRGLGYVYDEKTLFNAIWQYPSGPGPIDPPQKNQKEKAMVVISK